MELNHTPVKTSNNYGINSVSVNDEIISQKNANSSKKLEDSVNFIDKFENFVIEHNDSVIVYLPKTSKIQNENYLSEELKKQAEENSNFNLNIDVVKSSDNPIIINFDFNEKNDKLIDILNINIKENIDSNIILEYESKSDLDIYHNLNLKINVDENSKTNIIFLSNLSENSNNFVSIQSDVSKNAKLNITFIDFACKNSIFSYKSKIIGESGESNINSLYLGDNNSTIDLNYLVEIFAPFSKSNMEVVGAISGFAKKNFKGTIDFKKGCKKSYGSENEFCMLLSNTSKSKALPMLLCTEEDVDGKHSSSVGKASDKELFYIMSRGLTYTEAMKLIIKAKFSTILNLLFDNKIKTKVLEYIDRKIK